MVLRLGNAFSLVRAFSQCVSSQQRNPIPASVFNRLKGRAGNYVPVHRDSATDPHVHLIRGGRLRQKLQTILWRTIQAVCQVFCAIRFAPVYRSGDTSDRFVI